MSLGRGFFVVVEGKKSGFGFFSLTHFFFLSPNLDREKKNKKTFSGACQVDVLSTTLLNGVAQGTSKWSGVDDIIANIAVSDMIPCFTQV